VLEPQSTAFFLLLMLAFGGLVVCAVLAKQPVFRLLAATVAFVPAMLFGVAAVNKYYGYYDTWGAVVADFTSRGVQSIPQTPTLGVGSAQQFGQLLGNAINTQLAAQTGAEISVTVTGAASHITRNTLIYLPPQYFQKAYAGYRFPAIELIHGQPGEPEDWLAALDVQTTLQNMISSHQASPVVLVMPDVNGGRKISLQCLNQVGGPADDTFVAVDVPRFIAARLRVQAPGQPWGIAGYSEGGYCAANLALRHPAQFGFAGVLSGYFRPMDNRMQIKNEIKRVDPFHFNAALRKANSPLDDVRQLPAGSRIPQFWIGAARPARGDMLAAMSFAAELKAQNPATALMITPNGAHNAVAWRTMIVSMFEWMTPRLAHAAAALGCPGCVAPATVAAPNAHPRLSRPLSLPNQGQVPGRAQRLAGAAPLAALGAGRLPDTVRRATG
jgi:enterochelin esterase-like enzyme